MRTISSRHVTCLLLLGYCRVSYPKSFMPGKVPGHHKFSWPIASSCQKLKMSRNGKWWTIWINISKHHFLSCICKGSPRRPWAKAQIVPENQSTERTSKKTRTPWPHTCHSFLKAELCESVAGTLWCQPACPGLNICAAKLCPAAWKGDYWDSWLWKCLTSQRLLRLKPLIVQFQQATLKAVVQSCSCSPVAYILLCYCTLVLVTKASLELPRIAEVNGLKLEHPRGLNLQTFGSSGWSGPPISWRLPTWYQCFPFLIPVLASSSDASSNANASLSLHVDLYAVL